MFRPMRPGWWFTLVLACALVFIADLVTVEDHLTRTGDRSLELFVHHAFGHPWYQAFTVITDLGETPVRIGVIVAVMLALFVAGYWWSAGFTVIAAGGASLLGFLIKQAVRRPRPHLFPHVVAAGGWSFPSGHATDSSALALVLLYLVWHLWGHAGRTVLAGIILLVTVFLIGLSRIVLGVHYPTDVIGGYALAIAWVALVIGFLTPAFHDESTRVLRRRMALLRRR